MIQLMEPADVLFPPSKEVRIKDAAEEWLIFQDPRSTSRIYKKDLELFLSFLEENELGDAMVHEIDAKHVAAFQKRLFRLLRKPPYIEFYNVYTGCRAIRRRSCG